MKKILSLVLVLALVLSSISFAAADPVTVGQDLKALGVLTGDENGNLNPDQQLTREQAIVVLVRMMGKEADAKATTTASSFKDIKGTFYGPYIAYAELQGWTTGKSAGVFGFGQTATVEEIYAFMLRALGYTVATLPEAATKAAELKLNTDVTAEAGKPVLRGQVFIVMNNTLNTVPKDGKTALVYVLKLKPEVVVPVVKFEATAAKATNLKELEVTFSTEGDAAKIGDKVNYTVNGVQPAAVKVGADKKTVTLTLAAAIAQQGTMEVKVLKAAGAEADKTIKVENIMDVTIPVAESIVLTGPKTFDVTFSEPVQAGATPAVVINNGLYGVTDKTLSTNGRVLTVTIATTLTDAVKYEVKVSGYKDFANFEAMAKTFELTYVKDTVVPTVEIVSASQTEVVVKFSKKVYRKDQVAPADKLTVDYFYHSYTAWKPVEVTTDDYQTYTLSFKDANPATTDYYLPTGTSVLTVLKEAGSVKVVDAWGNLMAADGKLNAVVTADATAPLVTKVEATAENKLEVTFDEDVTTAVGNYTVKGADGKAAATGTITFGYASKKATLTFQNKLAGGTYTVEIKDVKDTSLAENKIVTIAKEFVVTDKTPATVTGLVVETLSDTNPEFIYLTYSEDMDTASTLNAANYQLNGAALPTGSKVEAFMGSASKVKITVPDQSATLVGDATTSKLTVGQVADKAGNKIVALATKVVITADTAPSVTNVKTLGLNKIQFTVTGLLDVATVTADGATINADGDGDSATLASIVSVEKKDGNTTVVAFTQATENFADSADIVNAATIVAGKWKSETGKEAVLAGGVTYTDGISPAYVSIAQDNTVANKINIVFDEALATVNDSLAATDFVLVDKDAKTFVPGTDYTLTVGGAGSKTIIITLTGKNTYSGKLTVSTKDAVVYTLDQAATPNKLAVFTGKEVTVDQTAADISNATTVQTAATRVLTVDTNPTANDTMTIGATVYTFKAVAAVAGDILIGADVAATQANILAALAGTDGLNTANAYVTASAFAANATTLTAKAAYNGAFGNTVATTETFTAVTNVFAGATLTGGQDVVTINLTEAYLAADIDNANANTDLAFVNSGAATVTATTVETDADTLTVTVTASDKQIKGATVALKATQVRDLFYNNNATTAVTIN